MKKPGSTAYALILAAVLGALAAAERGVRNNNNEWDSIEWQKFTQRKRRRRKLAEMERNKQSQQQQQRTSRVRRRTLQSTRDSKETCDKVVRSYAQDGASCACYYDTIMDNIVTLECGFHDCEECVNKGRDENDQICATIETTSIFYDPGPERIPVETSYTECLIYTRGRSDTMCYTEFIDQTGELFDECFFEVNGNFCNKCGISTCDRENTVGLGHLDCSNIEGGSKWDVCNGTFRPSVQYDSLFFAFSDLRKIQSDGCPRYQTRLQEVDPIIGENKGEKEGKVGQLIPLSIVLRLLMVSSTNPELHVF